MPSVGKPMTRVAIAGGGIAGLALALNLHKRGIDCRVFEAAPEVRELGVGITLLPHAMRELTALGLQDQLRSIAIENTESAFFNRFGQRIYGEARGVHAGYAYPELGIHRGKLHTVLYRAALEQLGADRILTGRRALRVEQDEVGATLHLQESITGAAAEPVRAEVVIACDGVNSTIRKQFYPDETVAFTGINTWRGVTRRKPILGGRTYMRIGSLTHAKLVVYPIIDDIDGTGDQLINWTAEVQTTGDVINDWNKPGDLKDLLPYYADWKFDWLDVPALFRASETIFEYPMVDKDPVARWTFGRTTFVGDAAHPMYPRGSNGSAQALIDARTLADLLATDLAPKAALKAYEATRLEPTAKVVRTNRSNPPDVINIRVEELTGDRPFENLDSVISQDELRALSDHYKRVAGFALQDLR